MLTQRNVNKKKTEDKAVRKFIPKCGVCYKIHRFPWKNMASSNEGIPISRHSWLVKFNFGE